MSEFKVKIPNVRTTVQDQNNIAKQMKKLEDEIRQVRNGLSFEVAQKERIKQRLKAAGDDTATEYNSIYNATKALNRVTNEYETTETKLSGVSIPRHAIKPANHLDEVLSVATIGGTTSREFKTLTGKTTLFKEENDDSWYSKNNENGELKASKHEIFKLASMKWSESDSMYSDNQVIGDEDGTHIKSTFDVLKHETSAEVYAGLYTIDTKTGKKVLRPGVGVTVGSTVSLLTASQEAQLGDKYLGAYVKTEETIGKVELKGDAVVGLCDADGNFNPTAHAKLSAEALLVEASAKAGVKIMGADVGVKGTVNVGIGAHAEVGYKDGVFSADIGASLGLGASVKLEVDVGGVVDAVSGTAKSAWNTVSGWFKK